MLIAVLINTSAFAQEDGFLMLRPVDGLSIGLGNYQAVVLSWRDGGSAVPGEEISFSTTHGTLSAIAVDTNAIGIAFVLLSSSTPGDATIRASSSSGELAEVSVTFEDPPPAGPTYQSGGRDISVTVREDRMGIQAAANTTSAQIIAIAADADLTFHSMIGRGLYLFELSDDYSLDSLQQLARRLEQDYPTKVRNAGPAVETPTSSAPMLLTGEVVAGYAAPLTISERDSLINQFPIATIEALAPGASVYRVTIEADMQWDVFRIANEMIDSASPRATFAHPNFIIRTIDRAGGSTISEIPCEGAWAAPGVTEDPYYCQQWHHNNRGLAGGVVDADIDTPAAWAITSGGETNPLLAILDSGFSITHPDLEDNLWTHPLDGWRGLDYFDGDHTSLLDHEEYPNSHGTSVAGIAGAIADNEEVGRGVCPGCKLLLIRNAADPTEIWQEFNRAVSENAVVISNSWGPEVDLPILKSAIQNAAVVHDIPILFATASVQSIDRCNSFIELSSIDEHVIAVSSSTYLDDRTPSGKGNCVDVLAPSRRLTYNGVVTTAVKHDFDSGGHYNTYTSLFGGTSAATPMVAGTIGLMVDIAPGLSRVEIQRILQDTADKIRPGKGDYDPETGYSQPDDGIATHAFGRINAYEAVSLVAPFDSAETDPAKRGHGGKDLFLRDHALDWGNTGNPSSTLFTATNPRNSAPINRSVDIKVDAFPFQEVAATLKGFNALDAEEPVEGEAIKVYVRVRNRGPDPVNNSELKLHWTLAFPLTLLQDNFWTDFPADVVTDVDPRSWNPVVPADLGNVPYSGSSIAFCPDRSAPACLPTSPTPSDQALVRVFDLPAMMWNEDTGDRLSLLVVAHSDDDPPIATLDVVPPYNFLDPAVPTAWDNNVALWTAED